MCKITCIIKNQNYTHIHKKAGEEKCFRGEGGSSETLHFENEYSFGKSIFLYRTSLLGQQISAAVIFPGFRNNFILLVSFNSSVLYNLKPCLGQNGEFQTYFHFFSSSVIPINVIVTTLFPSRSTSFVSTGQKKTPMDQCSKP